MLKKIVKKMFAVLIAIVAIAMVGTANTVDAQADDNFGSAGRLYFNNGYSVALNYVDPYNAWEVQSVCDAWDSAVVEYVAEFGSTLIADHSHQGFNIIKSYGVGSTVTIKDAWGGSTTYVCVSYYSNAYWYDGYTVLPDGRDAWFGDSSLWMKTCNADGTNTVSYWAPAW